MHVEPPRSREARATAEAALVSVVYHYGSRPEFVVIGGLVPELLCSTSGFLHAGTTDVDVQVNFEIACGESNAKRLEDALIKSGFQPDSHQIWRWTTGDGQTVVKFELLADLDDRERGTIEFANCDNLGAANLRGTGFAARDTESRAFEAVVAGSSQKVEILVTGLAGFLLAKIAAAGSRHKAKDWYDIAFVLIHNNAGGTAHAMTAIDQKFSREEIRSLSTAIGSLQANFENPSCLGPQAYAQQMISDHPDHGDQAAFESEAIVAVKAFCDALIRKIEESEAPRSPTVKPNEIELKQSQDAPEGAAMTSSEKQGMTVDTNQADFANLRARIRERLQQVKEPILLCIPMWGFTADGKTTALLTALHYADAMKHGIGLRYVKDPSLLAGLDGRAEYHSLNLRALAAATKEQLGQLEIDFIDNAKWPRGNDRGTHYLLELDNSAAAPVFCLFPDLTGGSYEDSEDDAVAVLNSSPVWGVLVNARGYTGSGTKAKNYRDAVRGAIQRASRERKPFCVMLTKADQVEGDTASRIDAAQSELRAFINELGTTVANTLLPISVTGTPVKDGDPPPPAAERTPKNVVEAYAWLIDRALEDPASARTLVPATIRNTAKPATGAPAIVPELRRVSEQSSALGIPLCDCSDDSQKRALVFIADDGALTEVTIPLRSDAEPTERSIGTISDIVPADAQAEYVSGDLMVAARHQPKVLWLGRKGELRKTTFSLDIFSWSPVTSRRLVAVDNGGRVHSLKLNGERWQQADAIDDIAGLDQSGGHCQVVGSRSAYVGIGDNLVSIALDPNDTFGARSAPIPFEGAADFMGNRSGLLCVSTQPNAESPYLIRAFDGAATRELGIASSPLIAVAQDSNLVAWVGSDGKLAAAEIEGKQHVSLGELSSAEAETVRALSWTAGGEALVALFDGNTWGVYMPKGIPR